MTFSGASYKLSLFTPPAEQWDCCSRNLILLGVWSEKEAGDWGTSATEAKGIQSQIQPKRVFISCLVGHLGQTKLKYIATFQFAFGNKTAQTVEWKFPHCISLWMSIVHFNLDCRWWQESSCAGKSHMLADFYENWNIDPFFPTGLLNPSAGKKGKQRETNSFAPKFKAQTSAII